MNKIIIFLVVFTIVLLSGCAVSGEYTTNDDLLVFDFNNKYDVSYSVSYISFSPNDDTAELKERAAKLIKEYLEESGTFNTISYRDFSTRTRYHIRFFITVSPSEKRQEMGALLTSCLTLFTIPTYIDGYYDVSASLYLNNELICAPSTCERMRSWLWLPLFPAIVYPPLLVRKDIEKKCYRYLINEILEEHKAIVEKTAKTIPKTTSSNTSKSSK